MPRKLTYEEVKRAFDEREYQLLTTEYRKNTDKLQCICPKGHLWETSFMNFRMGSDCPTCIGKRKLTYSDVVDFVRNHDCAVLTPESEYKNTHHPIDILCACGKVVNKSYHAFVDDQRCMNCRSEGYENVHNFFNKHKYILLEEAYINSSTKMWCMCPNGHATKIAFGKFKDGTRCKECQYETVSVEYIRHILFEHGYIALDRDIPRAWSLFDLVCPQGHIYTTSWNTFQQGHRCNECYNENNVGENNPHWNHSITAEERIVRRLYPEYKQWRESIFIRDNFTCQVCAKYGGKLVAHHLNNYADFKNLRTVVENGVTLCSECHDTSSPFGFHRRYGTRHTTIEQYYEYKQWRQQQLGLIDIEQEVS